MKTVSYHQIDAPESDYLYIETSQLPNAGNGLYSAIDIYKDERISIFKGKILRAPQASTIAANNQDQYFIIMPNGRIMDSMHTDCFAKYANDAAGLFNSVFKNNAKIALDDENNVCLIAVRKIKSGEEIFCAYGKKYWKKYGKGLEN